MEEAKKMKEEARNEKTAEMKKKSAMLKKCAKFMAEQEDYDSQPDEDLDMTPEWSKDRAVVADELEDTLGVPPFDCWKVMRG